MMMTKDSIKAKIKAFFSQKIELRLPTFGKPATSDSFIFYSPTSDRTFKIEKNFVSACGSLPESGRFVSFLTPQVVRNEELALSKFIPNEELASNIEIKAFDELGLDAEMDYKIVFELNETLSAKRTDGQNIYNIYIASALETDDYLQKLLEKTKYIDSTLFAPLALKRFFHEGYLHNDKTYVLVYLYKNLSFLCIYDGGNLSYIKGLKVTLDGWYALYCDSVGDKLPFADFVQLFCKADNIEAVEALMNGYKIELFKAFSDVLTHAKRLLGLQKFDTIFISSEYGDIVGIDELGKQYFETPIKHLNFKLALFGEPIDSLSAAIILDAIEGAGLEFTTHVRPLPVMQRKSGKFLALVFASIVVCLVAPFAKYMTLSENITKLQKEYDRVGAKQGEAEALIGQKNTESKQLEAQIGVEKNISAQKGAILKELAKTKEPSKSVSTMIVKIANVAYSSGVKFDSIEIDDISADITIKSNTAYSFTQFVKNLSRSGLKTKAGELKRDGNSTIYVGQVEVYR
jgi:hypothetical protein